MKIRRGEYEVEGSPAEVAQLLRHLENPSTIDSIQISSIPYKEVTANDIWGIREDSLRDFVRFHPWSGPGAVAEHFFGRSVVSTGDDRPLYHALYRRIGDARRFWDQTRPGWNLEKAGGTRSAAQKETR